MPLTARLDIPHGDDAEELHQEVQLLQADAVVPAEGPGDEGGDQEQQRGVDGLDARVPRPHRHAGGIRPRLDLLDEVHRDPFHPRLDAHQPGGDGRRDGEYQHVEGIVRPHFRGFFLRPGHFVLECTVIVL